MQALGDEEVHSTRLALWLYKNLEHKDSRDNTLPQQNNNVFYCGQNTHGNPS